MSLLSDLYSQFFQLTLADRSWRVHHEVRGASGFGKWDDFAQAVSASQDHYDSVEAEGNSAVWRRAVFERLEEESEAGAGFFVAHPQRLENLRLNILTMDTNRTRAEFGAIQHDVISKRANLAEWRLGVMDGIDVGFELGHVFFMKRGEGMMRWVPALFRLVPFEHGEI